MYTEVKSQQYCIILQHVLPMQSCQGGSLDISQRHPRFKYIQKYT